MIILVNIARKNEAGMTNIQAAYRAWECGRLLSDPDFRNSFKYLVAYANGTILETYCIHGVALDPIQTSNRRKVQFNLQITDPNCDSMIRASIQPLIDDGYPKIIYCQTRIYLFQEINERLNFNFRDPKCKCALDIIPLLEANQIQIR